MSASHKLEPDAHLGLAEQLGAFVAAAVFAVGGTPADLVATLTHMAAAAVFGAAEDGQETTASHRFAAHVQTLVDVCVAGDVARGVETARRLQ